MPTLISPEKFQNWLVLAPAGDRLVYHTGQLAAEREREKEFGSRTITIYIEPENTVATMAYNAYTLGRVELVQKRVADHVFDYIAIKRNY
jgi:hypothetical protein